MSLPRRKSGYQHAEDKARYEKEADRFCDLIRAVRSTLGFPATARGYCYYLEGRREITKGEFNKAASAPCYPSPARLKLLLTT